MAIHKNATTIFANFKKCHFNLQTLKNATQDFEKCHWRWHEMAFFKVWKLQTEVDYGGGGHRTRLKDQ